jgi:hypothetical protein
LKHLNADQLSAILDGAMKPAQRDEAERHLASCEACRDALGELAAQDTALHEALDHDPGGAYFDIFSQAVLDRIEVEKVLARAPESRGLHGWLARPRNVALVSAAATVLVVAGAVLVSLRTSTDTVFEGAARSKPVAATEDAKLKEEGADRAPAEAETWPAAPATKAPADRDESAGAAAGREESGKKVESDRVLGQAQSARALELRKDERTGEDVPVGGRPLPAPAPAASGANELKARQQETQRSSLEQQKAAGDQGAVAPLPATRRVGSAAKAQPEPAEWRVCGDVRDSQGRPLRFAAVHLVRANLSAETDDKGRFCVVAPIGEDSLVVTLVGFQPHRGVARIARNTPDLEITLQAVSALGAGRARTVPGLTPGTAAPAAPTDPFAALSDSARRVLDSARASSATAARSGDARQHEAAAAEWARLLRFAVGPAGENEIRARMADERFLAWQAAPTYDRKVAAREALTHYLVRAPLGTERDQAIRRLDQVAR